MDQGTDLISWMAWTWPTACFFGFILLCLIGMSAWEKAVPGGGARHGILGLDTTRGDRLFISLLGTAYIVLAWLGFFGTPLYAPLVISILYVVAVFLWV